MNNISRITFLLALLLTTAVGLHAQDPLWRHLDHPYGGSVFFFITAPNLDIYTGTEMNGMFRSSDEGGIWQPFGPSNAVGVLPVLFTKQGSIFAITDDKGDIYRSTDGGQSWAQRAKGVVNIRPGFMTQMADGTILMGTSQGLYRSSDEGAEWSLAGLNTVEIRFPTIDPDGTIFVASEQHGLFRSTDNGTTWTEVGNLRNYPVDAFLFLGSGELLVGTDNGIFRSTDNGDSFTPFAMDGKWIGPFGLGRLPGGELVATTRNDGLFSITSDGATTTKLGAPSQKLYGLTTTASGAIILGYEGRGILRSIDGGTSFHSVGVQYGLDVSSLTEGLDRSIYVGGPSLYRSLDGGETWNDLGLPEGPALHTVVSASGTIFVAGKQGIAFHSTDDGATWSKLEMNVGPDFTGLLVTKTGTVIMSSNDGIIRSTDNGEVWNTVLADENVYAIDQSPGGELWGIGYEKTYHSTDDGETWKGEDLAGDIVTSPNISAIASPGNGTILLGGNLSGQAFIARSTDNGVTWDSIPFDCDGYVSSFSHGPGNTLFVVSTCGIFRSTDDGAEWSLFVPLPTNERSGIFLSDTMGNLWFGNDRGVYTTAKLLGVDEIGKRSETHFSLRTFPNPARSEATITFHLEKGADVRLSLMNLLGQQIGVIVDRAFEAGEHSVHADLDRALQGTMANGTYILNIRVGDRSESTPIHIVH